MEQNDRNENINRDSNENKPLRETNNPLPDNAENNLPDLDGDGMIGNTGGFYGGTSYLGSNYGSDWNEGNSGDGNYGAAGNKDDSDDDMNRQNKKD